MIRAGSHGGSLRSKRFGVSPAKGRVWSGHRPRTLAHTVAPSPASRIELQSGDTYHDFYRIFIKNSVFKIQISFLFIKAQSRTT